MGSKTNKRLWPNVYSRTHRSGQVGYMVDLGLINGKAILLVEVLAFA